MGAHSRQIMNVSYHTEDEEMQPSNGFVIKDARSNEQQPRREEIKTVWNDIETVIQSEVSQKEKTKYCILTDTCGIRKIIQMILFARQKQRHRHSEKMYGHQGGTRGVDELGDWPGHTPLIPCNKIGELPMWRQW